MIDPQGAAAVPVLEDADDHEQPPANGLPQAARAALLDPAAWQDSLHKFCLATNLAAALVDAEGRALMYRNPRPLWSLFRDRRPAAPDECLFALAPVGPCQCVARAFETGRPALARDRTGLVHLAVPLMLGDDRLGALVAGQVFTQYPEQLAVQHLARHFGLSPEKVWHQARLEQPVKRATLEVYADLLETLGQTFIQSRYHALVESDRLAEMTRLRDRARAEIEQRKRADEENARLAAIVETSDDAIISNTLDGVIRSWNRGAERMFGYSAAEAVGQHISLIIPPARHPEEEHVLAALRRGERVDHFETERRAKDGRCLSISLTVSPIQNAAGDVIGASNVAHDITGRKRAEEELREADRRKNEFLAMLAHELRNPLAPIRNSLELLRLTEGNPQAVQSASKVMERQIGQMVRLIDDLLDVSRISRGRIVLRKERLELASVVHHAVEAVRPLIQDLDQELTVTLPPEPLSLEADRTRLAQIVGNLLSNACKFTGRGGRIWLTVEVEDGKLTGWQGDKAITSGDIAAEGSPDGRDGGSSPCQPLTLSPCPFGILRVRDTGVGIAPDQLRRIFDMFVQVDSSLERSVGGLGIGLTLVKSLVELHGGTVEVHSAGIGQGSEFLVRLPIVTETPEPPPPPPAVGEPTAIGEPAAATSRRILVVDDNRDAAESLALLLTLTGHETQTAYDGLETIEAASMFRPDVVLLDIGMPKLNGYEAARRIREQPWGQDMLLVALTGWGQEDDRKKSREAGFNGHLVKPVDYDALGKLLAEVRPGQVE